MVVDGWKGTITPGGHCSARLVPSPHVIVHSLAPSELASVDRLERTKVQK